ncbi:NAD(P)-dependent oxidoreductase [Nocardioides carbamazepini]|uniref:NAD-dependent epimerase/dehydratase family protein n=1 Tax=Nocardioides carbamazepini TaxID=2854259 RepID=UPI00214A2E74|nr:NAD(P)-dependent oxidoreductase [Nocardioides carbamazepini]MCR1783771.1 NAD(P)-dependent oxidoreductase [Nocardioides carbamazepini]
MNELGGQRWAVTGAAGNIGRALREFLSTQAVELVSIDLAEITAVSMSDHPVRGDVRDLAGLETAFADCSGVVHLGGLPDEADFHDLAEVNIVGTYHVLEAARRAGVSRVVYASSNRVTGFYDTDTTVDESMPPRPDGFYGASKVAGEALCRLYADKFHLSTIVIRIGSYEQAPGSARELHTWLSPDDALRAFQAAMTAPQQHATFYAVSQNTQRWWSLASARTVGFVPVDNAEAHGDHYSDLPAGQPQGGLYASAEYSLDRMRTD